MSIRSFYTKNGKVRPISRKSAKTGSFQTSTVHLSNSFRVRGKPIRRRRGESNEDYLMRVESSINKVPSQQKENVSFAFRETSGKDLVERGYSRFKTYKDAKENGYGTIYKNYEGQYFAKHIVLKNEIKAAPLLAKKYHVPISIAEDWVGKVGVHSDDLIDIKNGKYQFETNFLGFVDQAKKENQKLTRSLSADIKDEKAAGPDYRKEADKLDKAGYPIQADELRHIARQEDDHKKILTEVKKDINQPLHIPMPKSFRAQELDEIKRKINQTSDPDKLIELRRSAHEIWYNERNFGANKQLEKEARKTYDEINYKIDSNKQRDSNGNPIKGSYYVGDTLEVEEDR